MFLNIRDLRRQSCHSKTFLIYHIICQAFGFRRFARLIMQMELVIADFTSCTKNPKDSITVLYVRVSEGE